MAGEVAHYDDVAGLPLRDQDLAEVGCEGVGPLRRLAVVNLEAGDVEHGLTIEGVVEELYDIAVLPKVIRPCVLCFRTEEMRFLVRPELPPRVH